jgi:D-xylose transport system permease protein
MSTASPVDIQVAAEDQNSFAAIMRARWEALKAGDVGSLPVIIGIVGITIYFTLKTDIFFSAVNLTNLIGQMAGVTVIGLGVVFVLLIGEIDLSVGFVSGVAGVTVAELQLPGSGHQFPGLVAIACAIALGAVIGAVQGSFVALLGVPSFVVTLAGLLIWQGVILYLLGTQGVIGIEDQLINDIELYLLPPNVGWVVAGIFAAGLAASALFGYVSRKRAGLPAGNIILIVIRVLFYGGLAFAAIAVTNHSRGMPVVALIILFLVVLWSFAATRTSFGRHVYAVGGNAEAARRAGINVARVRILCFMICSSMAAFGGVIFASYLNSVDLTAGGSTILLDSISAAVIGGVSLFGGRGRVSGALFGGLIIGMIANGIDAVGYTDAIKFITTGVILLAAVTLDTVARRRQVAAGR